MTSFEPGEDGVHHTYCRICEAQCGLLAEVDAGKIVRVTADHDHPVSKGHLCIKGPGMLDVTYDPDRVLTPLRRVGAPGEFETVSWDDALDDITKRLVETLATHGEDSIACYIGNPVAFRTLNAAFAFGFIHQMGGYKIFSTVSVDTGARNLASTLLYGNPAAMPFPDLERCDFLLMLGANPAVSKMSLIAAPRAMEKLRAIAKRGSVVVVDPRRTETARAFEHLPIRPDSDAWLLAGMLRTLVDEGLVQTRLLAERVTGWEELADALAGISVTRAAERCGVAADEIESLARRLAAAPTAAVYGRCGTNRGSFSTLINVLMDALNLATGRFGVDGGSVFGAKVFTHESAGIAHLPKGVLSGKPSRIGDIPRIIGMEPSGTLADEILTPGEGQVRALFIDSGNPVLSLPDGNKLERALESLSLTVAFDLYVTESTKYADYILPAPTFLERADLTDLWVSEMPEPWLQYVDAVIEPRGESRSEYEVYDEILRRAGRTDPLYGMRAAGTATFEDRTTALEVADAALRRGPLGDKFGEEPDGLSIERLRNEFPSGFQFADNVTSEDTWRGVMHPGNRPSLWNATIAAECARLVDSHDRLADDELLLFGRRSIGSINTWNHNSDRSIRRENPTLLIHPDDAQERGLVNAQRVRIATKTNGNDARHRGDSDRLPRDHPRRRTPTRRLLSTSGTLKQVGQATERSIIH